ncbi:MAG: lysylphosphatidylglycerol synthase transmembrane domain-containing protein, partial [Pseudomonadota bacterium]
APLSRGSIGLYLAALIALLASIAVAALRWSFLTQKRNPIGPRDALSITFAAQFLGQVLPSSLGQDAARAWFAARGRSNPAETVSLIVADRLCGVAGLAGLIGLGLPRLAEIGGLAHSQDAGLAAGGLTLLALVAAFAVGFVPAPHGLPRTLRTVWTAAREAARVLISPRGAAAIAMSVGVQLLITFSMWLIALGMGLSLSPIDALATVPIAMFVSLLPISINGWGVREGVMMLSLGFAGVRTQDAFAVSVLFGLGLMMASLPGIFSLISLRRTQ